MYQPPETIAPDDLRAEMARARVHAYLIAARVRINPARLSRMLHGHARLTPADAARILRAIRALAKKDMATR